MPRCLSCSAPLPANTLLCAYCGTRNDIDLRDRNIGPGTQPSQRLCPVCDTALQTVEFRIDPPLAIERCQQCFGLFFDPGEVEALLTGLTDPVFVSNPALLTHITNDRRPTEQPVGYRRCPDCRIFMNRVAFGYRSGVVIDRCTAHGVWLDGGELTRLLEWKKAGGQLLQARQQARQAQRPASPRHHAADTSREPSNDPESTAIEAIFSIASKLFER